ncbi:unnamed protein product [Linum trigynum]|uniref:Transposase MuDR plant domain-containing protein n=1 Tax=Linum trigynum TaxID=586398 RepID=A0AAV2DU27_9ROSI
MDSDEDKDGAATKGKKGKEAVVRDSGDDADYEEEDDSDYEASEEEEDFSIDDNLQFERSVAADVEADFYIEEDEIEKCKKTSIEAEESSYVDSDDRRTICSSDEDEDSHQVEDFRAERDMESPTFDVLQRFGSFDELKDAIKQHAFVEKRPIRFKKNDKRRLQAVCVDPCDWYIWASKMILTDAVQINKCKLQHSTDCQWTFQVKFATAKFLGEKLARKMAADKNMSKGCSNRSARKTLRKMYWIQRHGGFEGPLLIRLGAVLESNFEGYTTTPRN